MHFCENCFAKDPGILAMLEVIGIRRGELQISKPSL
jgi:hypothetical protein